MAIGTQNITNTVEGTVTTGYTTLTMENIEQAREQMENIVQIDDANYAYFNTSQLSYSGLSGAVGGLGLTPPQPVTKNPDEYSQRKARSLVKKQWKINPDQLREVKVRFISGSVIRTIINVRNIEESWEKGEIEISGAGWYMVSGKSFEWIMTKPFSDPNEWVEKQTEKFFKNMQGIVNSEKTRHKDEMKSVQGDIAYYEKELSRYQKTIEDRKEMLARLKAKTLPPDIDVSILRTDVESISRHKKVEDVYFSKAGDLIVTTHMLYGIDPDTDKVNENREIGRFVFAIIPRENGMWKLHAKNRDYLCDSHYDHPNISSGSICLGEHDGEILLSKSAYSIVDFLITFLSTYPHHNGSPYYPYDAWLENREKRKHELTIPERASWQNNEK